MNPSRRLVAFLFASSLLLVLAGCARQPASPTAPRASALAGSAALSSSEDAQLRSSRAGGWTNYYPLEPGDTWTYAREYRVETRPYSGEPDIDVFHSTIEATLVGPVVLNDVTYMTEQDVERSEEGEVRTSIYFRQDAHGLHEAVYDQGTGAQKGGIHKPSALAGRMTLPLDRIADPLARRAWERALRATQAKLAALEAALRWNGAGTPAFGDSGPPSPPPPWTPPGSGLVELLRLSYPLHTGQHWAVRDDPSLVLQASVEGPDIIRVGSERLPCWRIGYVWPDFFGPNDRVRVWYGPQGFLGMRFHLEMAAVDESGNVIGVAIAEENRALTGLSLVGARGGLAVDPER